MLITNGLRPPSLEGATKIASGDWADVYLKDGKILRAIYKADSTMEKFGQIVQGSNIQNSVSKIAPKVYSVGLRTDGRIWQSMRYLEGYQPVHAAKQIDPRRLKAVAKRLQRNNIAHGDINTGNIMVNQKGRIKLIDFDTATYAKGGSSGDRKLIERIGNFYKKSVGRKRK